MRPRSQYNNDAWQCVDVSRNIILEWTLSSRSLALCSCIGSHKLVGNHKCNPTRGLACISIENVGSLHCLVHAAEHYHLHPSILVPALASSAELCEEQGEVVYVLTAKREADNQFDSLAWAQLLLTVVSHI